METKRIYISPELKIVEFISDNVITTSDHKYDKFGILDDDNADILFPF